MKFGRGRHQAMSQRTCENVWAATAGGEATYFGRNPDAALKWRGGGGVRGRRRKRSRSVRN